METNIFLLCYNESALIPHAVSHYRKYLPNCKITIYDNDSTDNSVSLAKSLGCNVIPWKSNNIMNEKIMLKIRNECWKTLSDGWVIMADMDEFLCVSESELQKEVESGTSVLTVRGLDMIGESKQIDLSDIDLQEIKKYSVCISENKNLCFYRPKITDMDYTYGAHNCSPKGLVRFSNNVYINKHMNFLGLEFIVDKTLKRYMRNDYMRRMGMNTHYTNDVQQITKNYLENLEKAIIS